MHEVLPLRGTWCRSVITNVDCLLRPAPGTGQVSAQCRCRYQCGITILRLREGGRTCTLHTAHAHCMCTCTYEAHKEPTGGRFRIRWPAPGHPWSSQISETSAFPTVRVLCLWGVGCGLGVFEHSVSEGQHGGQDDLLCQIFLPVRSIFEKAFTSMPCGGPEGG